VCAPLFFSFLAVFSNPHRFTSRRRRSSSPTLSLDLPCPVILVVDGPPRTLRPPTSPVSLWWPSPSPLSVGPPSPSLVGPCWPPLPSLVHPGGRPLRRHHPHSLAASSQQRYNSFVFRFFILCCCNSIFGYELATSSMLDIFMLHLLNYANTSLLDICTQF
jgi:hypothetical protein